jgi:DNA-directed RNA polymerase sigma subunit (sigma70/sigma32)
VIFLDDRTKRIIERRFGPERVSLKVLATEFDLSISRISQIVKEGMKLIQTYSVEEKPDDTAFMELCVQVFPACKEFSFSIYHMVNALDSITNQKAALVIKFKYGLLGGKRLTMQEIADILGVSLTRIYQLEDEAIKHLQHKSRRKYFVF